MRSYLLPFPAFSSIWQCIALIAFLVATPAISDIIQPPGSPIRPLAQDHVIVAEADAAFGPLYNPSIVVLENGRLVTSFTVSGKFAKKPSRMKIAISDDGGLTWQTHEAPSIGQGRLFVDGNSVYCIGSSQPLRIIRSTDNGETWSKPAVIAGGRWHQSANNFIRSGEHIYLALEKRVYNDINAWQVGDLAPVLLRGRAGTDLTRAENWTFSSELAFADVLPGYRDNLPESDLFGVPFFPTNYPDRSVISRAPGVTRTMAPMGWLETNVAQITDPKHYWYDPSGKTFHLLMRAHTGGTGYAALAKVVENDDGTMTTALEQAPSGKNLLFLPMPGGHMRFHITYDEKTGLYWLLGSQSTDSMTRSEHLSADRFGLPNNERHRMVLHFSKNLVDWCFAGAVAITDSPIEARHYAAMEIDGNDLVILSRSGDKRARSAHDGNLITFHRVHNFRDLVY